MKEGFLKSVKSFFGSKPTSEKKESKEKSSNHQPRIVNFGIKEEEKKVSKNDNDDQIVIDTYDEAVDARYDKLDIKQTFKDLQLKKDEISQGETIIMVDTKFVLCKLSNHKYENVTLIQTDYKLFIKTKDNLTYFPLGKIEKLHKYLNNQNFYKLLIVLKDGRKFKFRFMTEHMWKKIYQSIEKFTFIRLKKHFFAFRHAEANRKLEEEHNGWKIYDQTKEFQRMGIKIMPHTQDPINQYTSDYKFLDNRDGKICTTYAQKLIVPSRMPYDCLVRCSKFRSRSRMPALTFVYQYEEGKFSSLYRSSQSKVGVQGSRSPDDELMLRFIGNHKYDPKQPVEQEVTNCIIYDARNYMAALGNKMAGKGFQSQEDYPNCKIQFLNIPNIHVVRQSYNKVVKAAYGQDSKFFVTLAESEWYDFIFLIISGSVQIAKNLMTGINVLIHCSDGWDRTAQLSSLTSIILDPYYRTMKGFAVLIEKDWIRFGHQFAVRMGQGANNPNAQQKSQIFLQFLDCVSQFLYQFPSQFQFNYTFLQQIASLSYSHLYGNFLCNCQLQLKKYNIEAKTISMWSYFIKERQHFLNPYYIASDRKFLEVSTSQKHMRFWKQHFAQYVDGFKDIYDIYSCKFTEDNLEIMYKHLKKEKSLLLEKYQDNMNILEGLDDETQKRMND